jgi:hypothetical protein
MKANRRRFLQGAAGASMALPWLESLAKGTSKGSRPPIRLAIFYVPIGVVRRGFFPGEQDATTPKFTSSQEAIPVDVEIPVGLRPLTSLTATQQPLERVKGKVTLITGMDRFYKNGSDVHAQCGSCFLSSATPDSVATSVYPLARTLDHVVADHVAGGTPFRTLELSCNSHKDNKESIYFDNISWYGTEHVAPSIRDPRKAFRRLFGTQEMEAYRNITDLVMEDARSMQKQLSHSDRAKFAEYFDSIRTIEEQMDKRERLKIDLSQVSLNEPTDAYLPRGEYIRLMGDLMVAALQTGLTNVATLMIGPERWDTPYLFESLFDKPMSHHQMSHNQHQYLNELLRVDHFHMQQYAYLVEKMDSVKEANGTSLLDNTIFTYGSGLGDGATHQYTDLPIIVAGGGGGQLIAGQHLHCAEGTPLANLWLTHAQAMGLPAKRFADSTQSISALKSADNRNS